MSRVALAAGGSVALLLLSPAAQAAEPWYERPACLSAAELVFGGDLEAADARIEKIEASRDADDQACGVWLRMALAELQLAIAGRMPALIESRTRALGRLFGFSRAHRKYAPRFFDLEMEARMRRVRILLDESNRSEAIAESKRVREMLEQRPDKVPPTPSLDFVRGVVNMAVGSSPWPVRTVLELAGLPGDAEAGKKSLEGLYRGDTVYRWDALYVARHFAAERPDGPLGPASKFAAELVARFPKNSRFLYDYAHHLRQEARCADALRATAETRKALAAASGAPAGWSPALRARLYLVAGDCALETGDKILARQYAQLARAQQNKEIEDALDSLESKL